MGVRPQGGDGESTDTSTCPIRRGSWVLSLSVPHGLWRRTGRDRSVGGFPSAGYEPASVMRRLSLNRSELAKKSGQNIPKNRCRTTIAERMVETRAELPFIGDPVGLFRAQPGRPTAMVSKTRQVAACWKPTDGLARTAQSWASRRRSVIWSPEDFFPGVAILSHQVGANAQGRRR